MDKFICLKEYRTICYNYIKIKVKIVWSIIIFFIILCILLAILKFDIVYPNKYIIVEYNNELFLRSNVLIDDLYKVNNNKYIYINKKKYKYKIVKIDNIVDNNLMIEYKTIYLKLYSNKYNIENNIINGNIIYAKKNCFKIIYDFLFSKD